MLAGASYVSLWAHSTFISLLTFLTLYLDIVHHSLSENIYVSAYYSGIYKVYSLNYWISQVYLERINKFILIIMMPVESKSLLYYFIDSDELRWFKFWRISCRYRKFRMFAWIFVIIIFWRKNNNVRLIILI